MKGIAESHRRIRVAIVGLLLVLLSVSGLPIAGAIDRPLSDSPSDEPRMVERLQLEQSITVEEDTHPWNNQSTDLQKIITVGNYQYTSYWDGSGHLTLARRDLRTDEVETLKFPDILSRPSDNHNTTVVGVSYADGRLHLSYDHHAQPLRYRYSDAGFLTDSPDEMTLDDFSPKSPLVPDDPEPEQAVTYPMFFNDPDGTLYFMYRDGAATSGDNYLHRYDATTNTWERVGMLHGRTGTYQSGRRVCTSRYAYLHDPVFDKNGRLHVSWIWRECDGLNHDINYAYSDDGGVTWHNNVDAVVADLSEDDPILITDDTKVVNVPVFSWVLNSGAMILDPDGQPHILTYRKPEISESRGQAALRYVHYWRSADGRWHERFVDDVTIPWTSYLGDPVDSQPLRRGDLFFDDAGNLHAYFQVGDKLYAAVARHRTGWADWRIYTLRDGPIPRRPAEHGMKFDRVRWERDGVISFAYSRGVGVLNADRFVIEEYALRPGSPPEPPELSIVPWHFQVLPENEDTIRVFWDGAIGAETYHVWRRAEDEESFTLLEEHFSERSMQRGYVDQDVEAGQTYTYSIAADNLFGTSDPAEIIGEVQCVPTNFALGGTVTGSREEPPRPESNVVDGDPSTFWVSSPGGATEETPAWLEVDLGQQRTISVLSMIPRPDRFGPKDIAWQVPDGAGGWQDVATAVAARSGRTIVEIDPVTTQRVRLYMTSGWDDLGPGGSNRNVQVAEMEVFPALTCE